MYNHIIYTVGELKFDDQNGHPNATLIKNRRLILSLETKASVFILLILSASKKYMINLKNQVFIYLFLNERKIK